VIIAITVVFVIRGVRGPHAPRPVGMEAKKGLGNVGRIRMTTARTRAAARWRRNKIATLTHVQ